MRELSSWKTICVVFVIYAATAIASPAQTLTTLTNFDGFDGGGPEALVQATDGNFYGTTIAGGNASQNCQYGCGTVFKITPEGTLTTLYIFCTQTNCPDGAKPGIGLVQATDGNFYGTTFYGGTSSACPGGCGTVFKITPAGTLTTLHSFDITDGAFPFVGPVQATDGNFYGTTTQGGTKGSGHCDSLYYGCGTVFKITPSGTLTTLHSFDGTDGYYIFAGLVQATDGNFYGTTEYGGAYGPGTVFKITPEGTQTTLHSFDNTDGANSYAGLVQAIDGNFYGTTWLGGAYTYGTVFRITPGGALTTLHSFDWTDGANSVAVLVQATDGNFYGTTNVGGANYEGTVFKITATGTLTTLYSFCTQANCTDGANPQAGLVQAIDGNLYGTTDFGGASNDGTVFQLALTYTLTVSTIGSGTVTSTDGYINCPGTCSHTYSSGAQVTLDATPGQEWVFGGWNGACLGTGSCTVTMTQSLTVGAVFSEAEQFVPLSQPCRAVDTRPPSGNGPIQGGTFQNFAISGEGSCAELPNAAVYSMNVTVVPGPKLGYLTIWPAGEPQPVVSTLNSVDGRVKADAAIVPAGTGGAVSIYVTDTTNVIVDVNGYFTPPTGSTLAFYPLEPCRVADTRKSSFPTGLGPPSLSAGVERAFPILNATSCNIPSSAAAYSLNFTVVPSGTLGYLTVWPTGQNRPTVSTLNDVLGRVIANAAIVVAGTGSEVSAYATNNTDLVIDINGYFAPAGANGLSLYPAAPCRVIDTRHVGSGQPFTGTLNPPVDVVNSQCGVSSLAQAYVFNATVIPVHSLGYLTLWPDGENQPVVSTLNAQDGSLTNNMAIVPTNNGKVDAYASGLTQLILDISSYFAP